MFFSWYYGNIFLGLCSYSIIFFLGIAATTFPKFSSTMLLFSISQSNFWVFLCHLISLTFAVCRREIGGKLELVLEMPKFKILNIIFLVVRPFSMQSASESLESKLGLVFNKKKDILSRTNHFFPSLVES